MPAAEAPAHIAVVDGAATIDRDGQSQPAHPNAPFVPGDRLRTTAGRVEVLLPDGSVLDVDQYSAIDLQSPALIRVVSGRILLVVAGAGNPASAVLYQIDTPAASARIDSAGEYRVAVLNGPAGFQTELAVLRGLASLVTERGSMPVRAGERSLARDAEAPTFAQAFNSARVDAFDMWAAARRDERTAAVSSQYLPQDLQMYGGTFDRYGSWQYTEPYGNVWYPTVAPDWRPYYYGYWSPYQSWGWTWIGVDRWAWPTHHFGRWGFGRNRWFWVPGRSWSPAWVAWGGAPGFVSWCPLGFDGRPVFAFSLGFASRWGGWTVLPRDSFVLAARVDRFAVPPHHLSPSTRFVVQNTAPVAVPRNAHAQNVTINGVGTGFAVRRPPGGTGPQPGAERLPVNGAVQSRIGTPGHEFKQALPSTGRAPAYAVPRQQALPAAPPAAADRAPYAAGRRSYSFVVPRGDAPAPQAVPRGTAPAQAVPPARGYPAPPARFDHSYTPPPVRNDHPYAPPSAPVNRPYAPPPPRADHPYAPPPPRADHPHAPPSAPVNRPYAAPPRADHPYAPPAYTPPAHTPPAQMAVPRTAPAPSTAPHSGGAPPPPPSHSGGSGGSSQPSHSGNSGRSSSGEAHRR